MNDQRVLMPWTVLDEPEDAVAFAGALRGQPFVKGFGTSISGALLAARDLLASAPGSDRQVVDVSGDGPNNTGLPLQPIHDALVAGGVTINGLAISLRATDTLNNFGPHYTELYYATCVIGGPSAFVIRVDNTADFAKSIRNKLVTEIAGEIAKVMPAAYQTRSRPVVDCVSTVAVPGR
jgi:hypothetical protein